jgi:predicted nucleotidyltransferase
MRHTGVSQGTLHRELKPLVRDAIIITEIRGKQVFYSVNRDSPIFNELRSIVLKTFGVADSLVEALKPFRRKIRFAAIYGSLAEGKDTARSDVDVIIIGGVKLLEITAALDKAERSLGREINPTVYPPQEFARKAQANNHFIRTVMRSPLSCLIGTQDDLGKLAGEQMD